MTRIEYAPTMEQCQEFLLESLKRIVDTTNKFQVLESDLMQNLPRTDCDKRANFPLDANFSWVVDARDQILSMTGSNMAGPNGLLGEYKRFEFLFNVDEKHIKKELFNN